MTIKRVLVVEDDQAIANLVVQSLRAASRAAALAFDLHVDVVGDGEQAIRHIHASPTDLVICDVLMPRLDGVRVARYIADHPEFGDTAMVMLTSTSEAKLGEILKNRNVRGYIQKPIGFKALKERLQGLLLSLEPQRSQ